MGTVLGPTGTGLTPPDAPTTRPFTTNCAQLYDPGFLGTCYVISSPTGQIAVLDEVRGNEERDLVYHRDGDSWELALRQVSDVGSTRFAEQDLNRDHDPKGVLLRGPEDSGSRVSTVDVVEATGKVVLHRDLKNGVVLPADGGGLETWSQVAAATYLHQVTRYQNGGWVIVSSETVPEQNLPKPELYTKAF